MSTSDTASTKPPLDDKTDSHENDEDAPPLTSKPSLYKLLTLARPEWPVLALSFAIMLGSESTGLLNPIFVARAYDALVDPQLDSAQRLEDINQTMLLVICIHCAGVVGGFVRASLMGIVGERVVARVRSQLYASILSQEIAFFDTHKSGELVSRLGSDTTLLQQGTSLALPEVLLGVTKTVVAVSLMFWLSPKLAGVSLGSVIVIMSCCFPFGTWIGKLSRSYQDVLGKAQTFSTEALGAMRTVQSFTAEEREKRRYESIIGHINTWWPELEPRTTYSVGFRKSIVGSAFYIIIFGAGFGSMYVSLWYGFILVNDGEMTLGELTAFQSYIFTIGASLGQTSRFITQLIEAQGASGRVFYLLERVPLIPAPKQQDKDSITLEGDADEESIRNITFTKEPLRPKEMKGAIAFHNVSFEYPSRPDIQVLIDFSLQVEPNSTVALVGASGAGKSTVVALLQRFYEVSAGSITIDGIDIRQLDLQWLRSHIGYVQQEPQLFGMSVRENVTYGLNRDVSDSELEEVCRKANAYEFIQKFPKGYQTLVGERGVRLSGGQKQRLAIARSLLVDPRILLLDEATSALDAESEHLVQEAINKAVVGRTVVIVAHRLSTIKNASQIVVIDDHKLVDVGSHDSLMERCVKYRDLIKRQSVVRPIM